jgi:hypothetical protein
MRVKLSYQYFSAHADNKARQADPFSLRFAPFQTIGCWRRYESL